MNIPFYRAFEDRYRGSRELIRERQQVYVPFLESLIQLYPESKALDLGCGRGEWLEILTQVGFDPLGVDLDTGMLDACHALGLPVEEGDALEMLKSLPDESLTVVSGFHIAEHIPFEVLKVLVAEALRVLKPAGLLILETPNTENLVVGTQNFFLDPTHERPIPHLLLSFLTEYSGFCRSKLLRLQESTALAEGGSVDLLNVLHGVSPDYAIIAQKQASPEQIEKFDAVFAQDYGLSLEKLARRYDTQLAQWMEQSGSSAVELREQLNHVQDGLRDELIHAQDGLREELNRVKDGMREELNNLQDALQELKTRLNESAKSEHHWRIQVNAYEARIMALLNSTSWRVTQPLRASKSLFRGAITLPVRLAKRVIRSLLVRSIRFVMNRPGLQMRISNKIKSYPRLFEFMRQFALRHGSMQRDPVEAPEDSILTASPRVTRIYSELKLAFESKENR
ncbi:methyltransferase domain-containing protein [Pseudomonas sp. SDO5532_S415]